MLPGTKNGNTINFYTLSKFIIDTFSETLYNDFMDLFFNT